MTEPGDERTLRQVADELGVHYMTVYRYVRLGMLPAQKVGSTWRVSQAALEAFRAEATGPAPDGRRRGEEGLGRWHARFEARLLAGDSSGAWSVLEAGLASGVEIEEVYLDVISPAMVSIGERWARGEIDVADEHLASTIVARLIGRLGPRFARVGRTKGTVLLGAAPGDAHALPVSMVADMVVGAGFGVADLGADVPVDSFVHAARRAWRLVAVGIAVTTPGRDSAVAAVVNSLHDAVPGVGVIIGGGAIRDEDHVRRLGADAHAHDAPGFVELLEAMYDRGGPPLAGESSATG